MSICLYLKKYFEHMPRNKCRRRVGFYPINTLYKPAGIPARDLEIIIIDYDEIEAIRLADLECLYHEQAAEKMNVSRQTFGRIIESAHKKIAEGLIKGKALEINIKTGHAFFEQTETNQIFKNK